MRAHTLTFLRLAAVRFNEARLGFDTRGSPDREAARQRADAQRVLEKLDALATSNLADEGGAELKSLGSAACST